MTQAVAARADFAATPIDSAADARTSRWFVHVALFSALILQKFGVVTPDGGSYLPVCYPVYVCMLAWLSVRGLLQLRPLQTVLYLTTAFFAVISVLFVAGHFDPRATISLPSLVLFLTLYATLIVGPSERFDTSQVIDIFQAYARFIACCGILQYGLQFIGHGIPSFSAVMPFLKPILLERFFNSNAIVEYGSAITRSNGLFLREPSTFSNLLVVAAVIDVFLRRRFRFLPVYGLAYVLSISGSGILAAGVALIVYSCLSFRAFLRLPLYALGLAASFLILMVAAPDIASHFTKRLGEFNHTGSSAYYRFVMQAQVWPQLLADGSFWTGLGPGAFGRVFAPTGIATNSLLKLTIDYGVFTAIATFLCVAFGLWWRECSLLSLLYLTSYQLGGGTELNPNFFIMAAITCIWSHRVSQADGPRAPGLPP